MSANRLAGIAQISIDGVSYLLAGELTYQVSSVTRETLTGQDGVHGFAEKPMPGMISGTFRDAFDLSVAAFNAMTDVTVTAQLNNGKLIVGRNMWTVEAQQVKTEEGTFEVKWEGQDVSEN